MSEWISETKEKMLIHWVLIMYVTLFTLACLCDALILALYGVTWSGLTGQEKLVISLMVFKNWATVMIAFFNKAAARVKSGDLPIGSEDTQFLRRTDTTKTTKTTEIDSSVPPTT